MTVFLKGCPLRCQWCHNPEGQLVEKEYRRFPNGCLHCGACEGAGGGRLTEKSVDICPRGLVRLCGEDLSAETLCDKIMKNASVLNESGGGVTFSGGEPLLQADYLIECMTLLRGKVHCALQTSGCSDEKTFLRVLPFCNYVLYDLKLFDEEEHKKYCGKGNGPILNNYRLLVESGTPFITRIPLIPGVTDTEENCTLLARYMKSLGVDRVELLPYNKLTGSKYSSLLRKYEPSFDEAIDVSFHTDIFRSNGINALLY